MSLIEKDYFTLPEMMERWGLPRADVVYLAENGRLRLSVRVFGLPIERGDIEETEDGHWFRIPYDRSRLDGLLELTARDAFSLFRDGEVAVQHFHAEGNEYVDLTEPEPFVVREVDVVISRAERNRFERTLNLSRPVSAPIGRLRQINDYREVRLGDEVFHLGAIQASVVKQLHAAARAGNPWRNGKELLTAAGSHSVRLGDVFKSQPRWRQLIESNGRGQYRLTAAAEPDAPSHPPAKS